MTVNSPEFVARVTAMADQNIARERDERRMTRDEWDIAVHHIGAIRTLCASYEAEHDWEADEDTSATREMLSECRAIHDKLISDLGEPPAVLYGVADPNIPF